MNKKDYPIETIRHSLAHVMAVAVQNLYPDAKFGMGPAVENGFYYDFDLGVQGLAPENLKEIEVKMKKLIGAGDKFERKEVSIDEAKELFAGQCYKLEIVKDLEQEGETKVSVYINGGFTDLCRGPHVEAASDLPADGFKLTKIAGAYWKGSEKNPMLTRIYGVAFASKKELDEYQKNLEEAEKRDHRKLGREFDLFHIDEDAGLGLVLWHPKGAMLWRSIEDFWYDAHLKGGYDLVRSPHIGSRRLWEKSGHWGFYSESMYPPMEVGQSLEDQKQKVDLAESEQYLLKPMNCPFHVQIYKNGLHSYREFPMRWAECGTVYRYEKKGELSGLTRVRGFTQDDAHIICRKDQVEEELKRVIDFIEFMYKSFGFGMDSVNVYLSLRDPANKEKYAGDDEGWEFTESVLRKVAQEKKLNFKEELGEAAFYGPKLDFKIKDVLGREWQCSTLQFDFNLPSRFDMSFINKDGKEDRPYMLHRALFGSFERFIGLLIEHYAGAFPVWLAPVQVKLLSVGEAHVEFCQKLFDEFRQAGIRCELDIADETLGNKIRKAAGEKIPYTLVIGDKEMQSDALAVRDRGSKSAREISKTDFIAEVCAKIKNRA
ncbi:MAG: threonine--tRNA ligase [Candidatus Pacebacteria bacterium]|jgi:threonyl-tRNA synthetase|nr:threonine--tRNA ligase [Candidatus Paceibacterota bacterium]